MIIKSSVTQDRNQQGFTSSPCRATRLENLILVQKIGKSVLLLSIMYYAIKKYNPNSKCRTRIFRIRKFEQEI